MFLPTKAHTKTIVDGQYKIRLGNRVPTDAVNLAYTHIPALNSAENLLVTDLSSTVLENARTASVSDTIMHPSKSLLLFGEDGKTYELPTEDVLITNIFEDSTPLYYAHRLIYKHYDNTGPDEYGMYQGNGITIVDRNGRPITLPYRVQLLADPANLNLYDVIVFTSFSDQDSDSYSVVYNAVKVNPDGRTETMAGWQEKLNLHRAFSRTKSLQDIMALALNGADQPLYYQGNGQDAGWSKLYVPTPPIDDMRRPQAFRYQIGLEVDIKGSTFIYTSPWYSDTVFNVNFLTTEEKADYPNGNKMLTASTAEQIMKPFIEPIIVNDQYAKRKYYVISDNDNVKTYTRLDGSSPVYGYTNVTTDQKKIQIPINAKKSMLDNQESGTLSFKVRPLRAAANSIPYIGFVLDESSSMVEFDEGGDFRYSTMQAIIESASDFYQNLRVQGWWYNFLSKPMLNDFSTDPTAILNAFTQNLADRTVTNVEPAIDMAVAALSPIQDQLGNDTLMYHNRKVAIVITDGLYDDFDQIDAKVQTAASQNVAICFVTLNNYDKLSAICTKYNTLCIDGTSARLATFLRYFFFTLAGINESQPAAADLPFTILPSENDKRLMLLQKDSLNLSADVLAEPSRYGIQIDVDAPSTVSLFLAESMSGMVIATYNGENILPLNYLFLPVDAKNPSVLASYYVMGHSVSYNYQFNHTYAVRFLDSQQIEVLSPRESDVLESWYVRIQNGRFDRQQPDGSVLRYSVPEYYTQNFSDRGIPYIKVVDEIPTVLSSNQIKVMFTPLYIDLQSGSITNVTISVNGFPMTIIDWDTVNGIFTLSGSITENDQIYVSYEYEEDSYVYRGFYDEVNQKFWSLDLNPSVGHFVTIRDRNDHQIKDVPSFALINETVYVYLKPTMTLAPSSTGDLKNQGDVNRATIFHAFEKLDEENVILIAQLHVRPNSNQGSVRVLDTRVRGGGLKAEITAAIMREFEEESKFYLDIGNWDGAPFSENAVVAFRISNRVLQQYGGLFTEAEVEEKINKHLAYGVLPIIEFIADADELLQIPDNFVVEVLDVPDDQNPTIEKPTFTAEVVS